MTSHTVRDNPLNTGVLAAIWGIYIAQGALGGLTFAGLPVILRSQHIPLEKIALLSLVMLVWAFKFLWAQPVERLRITTSGRRRSCQIILIGEFFIASILCVIAFWPPQLLSGLLALLLCAAFFATVVDIACDAFLIEHIPATQREKGNMAQVGGAYLGLVIGGSLFTSLFAKVGWHLDCFIMAFLIVFLTIPMFFGHHGDNEKVFPFSKTIRPNILNSFKRGEIWCGIALTITYEMSGRLVQGLTGPFLVDHGVSLSIVGLFNGSGGVIAGLCGTVAGGRLVRQAGAKNAMYVLATCHIIVLSALLLSLMLHALLLPVFLCLFIIEAALMAASFVASYSRLMAFTATHQPGIDFSLFQSASAITAALLGGTGAFLAGKIGYDKVFLIAAISSFITLAILPFINTCVLKYLPSNKA
ncbi:MFS transporter [Acetobacter vaccinii]|uniref:MFS transporter n=1 Tax=Acetobacter vaccinii TaxID=2592655 RepID=A0A5C1YRE4_9PROT|nr:MFS transporter [Acetobacter vaccinii]QEO17769.1 MFS transporter [Acetobacter vaccinii]